MIVERDKSRRNAKSQKALNFYPPTLTIDHSPFTPSLKHIIIRQQFGKFFPRPIPGIDYVVLLIEISIFFYDKPSAISSIVTCERVLAGSLNSSRNFLSGNTLL